MDDRDEFLGYVLDALRGWGAVTTRRMFGASGLFRGGVMFGFVADDELYLKVTDDNRASFLATGSEPFVYEAKGRPMTLSYWNAPAECLDDQDELRRWVDGAFRAALAADKARSRKRDSRRRRRIVAKG
jgi:DNA transformation protein